MINVDLCVISLGLNNYGNLAGQKPWQQAWLWEEANSNFPKMGIQTDFENKFGISNKN